MIRKFTYASLTFLLLAIIFSAFCTPANAADATANDYASLVAALNQAQPNDTITIDGEIVLTASINLYPAGHDVFDHTGITIIGINNAALTRRPQLACRRKQLNLQRDNHPRLRRHHYQRYHHPKRRCSRHKCI